MLLACNTFHRCSTRDETTIFPVQHVTLKPTSKHFTPDLYLHCRTLMQLQGHQGLLQPGQHSLEHQLEPLCGLPCLLNPIPLHLLLLLALWPLLQSAGLCESANASSARHVGVACCQQAIPPVPEHSLQCTLQLISPCHAADIINSARNIAFQLSPHATIDKDSCVSISADG